MLCSTKVSNFLCVARILPVSRLNERGVAIYRAPDCDRKITVASSPCMKSKYMHPIFNPNCQKTVQGNKKKEKRTEGRLSKRYLALDIEDHRNYK